MAHRGFRQTNKVPCVLVDGDVALDIVDDDDVNINIVIIIIITLESYCISTCLRLLAFVSFLLFDPIVVVVVVLAALASWMRKSVLFALFSICHVLCSCTLMFCQLSSSSSLGQISTFHF